MRLPKYRKHSSGLGFVEWRGQRHYFKGSSYGSPASKKAYNNFVRDVVLADQTPNLINARLTVFQLLDAYVKALITKGRKSEAGYFSGIFELVVAHAKNLPIEEFGPLKLKAIRAGMVDLGWSRSYINEQVQRLRRVIKWGVANEKVDASILANLMAVDGLRKGESGAPEPKKVKPAPLRDVAKVLRVAPPTLQAMIRTQWRTGLRSSHLCNLRILDIDMTSHADVWIYKPVHHEKGRDDVELICALGPRTQIELERR